MGLNVPILFLPLTFMHVKLREAREDVTCCIEKRQRRSSVPAVGENGLHIGFSVCRMHPVIGDRQKTAPQIDAILTLELK